MRIAIGLVPRSLLSTLPLSCTFCGVVYVSATVVGGTRTTKLVAETVVALGVVTVTGPVVVPTATMAVMLVAEFTTNELAAVPLKLTLVAPVRLVPVIVTLVPTGPVAGLRVIGVAQLPAAAPLPVIASGYEVISSLSSPVLPPLL